MADDNGYILVYIFRLQKRVIFDPYLPAGMLKVNVYPFTIVCD